MLKALELIGFKSFADKTRFEFPRGVTCVVGPNGSGKSNVVDAIKWVLGEQSVKSLRGKEMIDVIFNGSGSRPPLNSAEVTLTFDNSQKSLPVDTPEVHIGRRVYRSGESEYLINRQPCRLRDVRELFFGTGVGSEHYSVIEQGKVDSMLQASPRERRMIFEEAAGISRFKAKKVESQRRLERVEQNLLRLSDIVGEVEGRLRSVRLQATKAKRYQEHVERLQSLRTHVALVDWRALSTRVAAAEQHLAVVNDQRATMMADAEAIEQQVAQIEGTLAQHADVSRELEARASQVREGIAVAQSAIEHEQKLYHDLEQELFAHRQQLSALDLRAGDVRQQLADTALAVVAAAADHRAVTEELKIAERRLIECLSQLDTLRPQESYCRASHVDAMRQVAALGEEIRGHELRRQTATVVQESSRAQLATLDQSRSGIQTQLDAEKQEERLHAAEAEQRRSAWSSSQKQLAELRRELSQRSTELADQRQRHAVAIERAGLLAELEERLEGVTAGTKEVLLRARDAAGPFRNVQGLVADLIRVAVETAPLIDIVLGDRSQLAVVDPDDELMSVLVEQPYPFTGRVGFLRLGALDDSAGSPLELTGDPGVVTRADRAVEIAPLYQRVAEHLLGRTWIVEKLSDAIRIARETNVAHGKAGLSFVTLAGEFLAADGTLTVGPRQAATGLVSRRSELRALRRLINELEIAIAEGVALCEHLTEQVVLFDEQVNQLSQQHVTAVNRLGSQRVQVQATEASLARLDDRRATLERELDQSVTQQRDAEEKLTHARERLYDSSQQVQVAEEQLASIAERLNQLSAGQQTTEESVTAAKIELAKSDSRLSSLQARQQQIERDQRERQGVVDGHRRQVSVCEERLRQSQLNWLTRESQIALWYLDKESLSVAANRAAAEYDLQREQRQHWTSRVQQSRHSARKLDDQLRTLELQLHEMRLERQTLIERMRDDYGVELHELQPLEAAPESRERTEIEQEILDLRRKLNHLGNVNLDALDELQDLETRFATLSAQHQDLSKAKQTLEQIIDKIKLDSERLFVETLERVKVNFQALFRKLFGGGQADIVLEDLNDVLESGIEIVARPPGKELRSISLMSGGEKTMTCVALLLAIFQYRPSPFCVLDEVDAALDEANIERFTNVLREFLSWTQFIVVSHSKKTMVCAATLYGVTMQESGVSKRVAVRFEDVSEDGRIKSRGDSTGSDTEAA